MLKYRNKGRLHLNHKALKTGLRYAAHHVPVKSIGITMLATVATGIVVAIFMKKQ